MTPHIFEVDAAHPWAKPVSFETSAMINVFGRTRPGVALGWYIDRHDGNPSEGPYRTREAAEACA